MQLTLHTRASCLKKLECAWSMSAVAAELPFARVCALTASPQVAAICPQGRHLKQSTRGDELQPDTSSP